MEDRDRDALLQNLDARLGRVEQFLPSLSTREEMHAAIREAVAPLATREAMHAAITQEAARTDRRFDQVYAAIRQEGTESRHHMDILVDSLRDDIRIVAEGQAVLGQRLTSIDARVAALEDRR